MLTRYALKEVVGITLGGALLSGATFAAAGAWGLVPTAAALALLGFYRDPPRRVARDPAALLAPADGRVLAVERGVELAEAGAPGLRIVIFLSVLNVHVNRSPCGGVVRSVRYQPGRFHDARRREATEQNESNTLLLEPEPPLPGPVRVRQIAGLLARRIVCGAREGDRLKAGQRYGMIKLGSQTEVVVPDDGRWQLRVREGDRVRAGLTVLAKWCEEGEGA